MPIMSAAVSMETRIGRCVGGTSLMLTPLATQQQQADTCITYWYQYVKTYMSEYGITYANTLRRAPYTQRWEMDIGDRWSNPGMSNPGEEKPWVVRDVPERT